MGFTFACDAAAIPVGDMAKVDVGGEALVVYHLEDGFYASQRRCPHALFPLDKGKIVDGQTVRCWLHHAVFDIRTGGVVGWADFPPGVQALNLIRREKGLKTFPTKVEDGKVYLDI